MTAAANHVGLIQRRLNYLSARRASGPMEQAELDALRWALPRLRAVVLNTAPRRQLNEPCSACKTPAGFSCAHLPPRT